MACVLTSGYSIPCLSTAGVSAVYIGTWNGPSLTYTLASDSSIATFSGSTVSFYTFNQRIENASFTHTGAISQENGTFVMENAVEISVHGMNQALANQIAILGKGVWRVIVKDNNGNYFLIGKTNPVGVTAITGGLGKAQSDLNGAIITFSCKEADPIVQVSSSAALSVIQ